MVLHNSGSYLMVKVNSKQYLDQPLMELKKFVMGKLNETFFLEGMVS